MICRRCGNRIPENLVVRESFQCPNCGRQFGNPPVSRETGHSEREARYDYDRQPRRASSRYEDARGSRYQQPRAARRSLYDYEEEKSYERRASGRYQPEYAEDDRYDDGYGYDDGYQDDRYDDGYDYDDGYQDDRYDDGYAYDDGYQDDRYDDGYGYDDGYQDDRYDDGYDYDDGYQDDRYDDGYGYDDGYDYDQPQTVDGEAFVQPQFVEPQDDEELSDLINGGRPRPQGMRLVSLLYFLVAAVVVLIVVFCISSNRKAEADKPGAIPPEAQTAVEQDIGTSTAADSQYPII